jgi:diguanylate cyclase (GGDEF)-like protein
MTTTRRHRRHTRLQAEPPIVDGDNLPTDTELQGILRLAAAISGAPHAVINLLDETMQYQIGRGVLAWTRSPRGKSMCQAVARSGEVIAVSDARTEPLFADNPWVDGRRGNVRLYASVPLWLGGGVIGTLCVHDDQPATLSCETVNQLRDLASLVVALLQRRRATAAAEAARLSIEHAYHHLERTQAFSRALLEALPVGVVAADANQQVTLCNGVSRRWHGKDPAGELAPADLPATYDLFEADGSTPLPADRIPLLRAFSEGRVIDAEVVIRPEGTAGRTVSCSASQILDDCGQLLGAVVTMTDVTTQRQMEQQLRSAALHDGLTGLSNRALLMDRLSHALRAAVRDGSQLAVLYCDLDGFKGVNDAHGHAVGDEILIQAAGHLLNAVRPGDTVARIGGDEFVLLCPGLHTSAEATVISNRVTAAFASPMLSSGGVHTVGISVGIALSSTDSQPDSLLSSADRAMYAVKRHTRRQTPIPSSSRPGRHQT